MERGFPVMVSPVLYTHFLTPTSYSSAYMHTLIFPYLCVFKNYGSPCLVASLSSWELIGHAGPLNPFQSRRLYVQSCTYGQSPLFLVI